MPSIYPAQNPLDVTNIRITYLLQRRQQLQLTNQQLQNNLPTLQSNLLQVSTTLASLKTDQAVLLMGEIIATSLSLLSDFSDAFPSYDAEAELTQGGEQDFINNHIAIFTGLQTDLDGLDRNNFEAVNSFIEALSQALISVIDETTLFLGYYEGNGPSHVFQNFQTLFGIWQGFLTNSFALPGYGTESLSITLFINHLVSTTLIHFREELKQFQNNTDPGLYDELEGFLNENSDIAIGLIGELNNDPGSGYEQVAVIFPQTVTLLDNIINTINDFLDRFTQEPTPPDLPAFFNSYAALFNDLKTYATQVIDINVFPPFSPGSYREYSFRTFQHVLRHFTRLLDVFNIEFLTLSSVDLNEQDIFSGHIDTAKNSLSNLLASVTLAYQSTEQLLAPEFGDTFFDKLNVLIHDLIGFNNVFKNDNRTIPISAINRYLFNLRYFQYYASFLNLPTGAQIAGNKSQEQQLETEIANTPGTIAQNTAEVTAINAELETYPQYTIQNFDDKIPVLLFPMRVETKFMDVGPGQENLSPYELWVRVYPDQIAIDTHEEGLTEMEIAAGNRYWTETLAIAADTNQLHNLAAWRAIVT